MDNFANRVEQSQGIQMDDLEIEEAQDAWLEELQKMEQVSLSPLKVEDEAEQYSWLKEQEKVEQMPLAQPNVDEASEDTQWNTLDSVKSENELRQKPRVGVQPQPAPGVQPQPAPGVQPQPAPGVQPQPAPGVQPRNFRGWGVIRFGSDPPMLFSFLGHPMILKQPPGQPRDPFLRPVYLRFLQAPEIVLQQERWQVRGKPNRICHQMRDDPDERTIEGPNRRTLLFIGITLFVSAVLFRSRN
ncbi:uncharacterized protein TNIN_407401 [Trichonephila inaurata madagascariensis]|uniref:Uncharacterized protein n=1 Tax=Trichonephila inaurata madagascariensis TaxID=2747483 RepID=A0A8X6WWG6_9ARAC|nr:uncharacterized protein TNIN_407401 [Trichonephila inaurata madagascariensis]